jgi:hypothetical protein
MDPRGVLGRNRRSGDKLIHSDIVTRTAHHFSLPNPAKMPLNGFRLGGDP